jgi:hypothetical protein
MSEKTVPHVCNEKCNDRQDIVPSLILDSPEVEPPRLLPLYYFLIIGLRTIGKRNRSDTISCHHGFRDFS